VRLFWLFQTFFIFFLAFAEFDNLAVIIRYNRGYSPAETFEWALQIPYTIIAFGLIFGLLTMSVLKNIRFLRTLSLILVIFTAAKVFLYDFHSLSQNQKITVLLILGIFLVLFSLAFPRMRNLRTNQRSHRDRGKH